jgi:hypothetical protein
MTTIRSGKTCLLSSMSNILLSKGSNVDEELIFLLGRGNRIDYRFSDIGGQPEVFLGHHSLEIVSRFCALFGVPRFATRATRHPSKWQPGLDLGRDGSAPLSED